MNVSRSGIDRRTFLLLAAAGVATAALAGCTPGAPTATGTARSGSLAPSPSAATPAARPPAAATGTAAGTATPPASSSTPVPGQPSATSGQPETGGTRIWVIIGATVLTGRLWDNATARDLIAQLPLTLTFSDFNNLEKVARLPRELSIEGMPAGDNPAPATSAITPHGATSSSTTATSATSAAS